MVLDLCFFKNIYQPNFEIFFGQFKKNSAHFLLNILTNIKKVFFKSLCNKKLELYEDALEGFFKLHSIVR